VKPATAFVAVSAISTGSPYQPSTHAASQTAHHQRAGGRQPSLSDIDAQGSSVASPPSSTGKVGSKLNVLA